MGYPFSLATIALALTSCGVGTRSSTVGPYAGCNVAVIVVDTLRADRLPFYGADEETAPFLASLAEKSVVFESAWTSSSWTAPATASIFSGLYPRSHGVRTGLYRYKELKGLNRPTRLNRLPPAAETLPQFFRSLGYRTFAIADNMNACERMGFARGFDRFHTSRYEGGDAVNAKLDEWADEILGGDDPWFVYLHYMDPHEPYHKREPWFDETDETARFAAYDSEIGYVDERIRRAFEQLGLGEDAIVVLVSDHGEEFGDHGGTGHTGLHGEVTRAMLLFHLPSRDGPSPTRRVAGHVSVVDVLPTLRELFGAQADSRSDGRSLARTLLSPTEAVAPRAIFSMRSKEGKRPSEMRAVVEGRYRAISLKPPGRFQLFDIEQDPGEQKNIAADLPEVTNRMHTLLRAFESRRPTYKRSFADPSEPDPDEEAALERLGYVEGD